MLLGKGRIFDHYLIGSKSWWDDGKRISEPLELVFKWTRRSVCVFLSSLLWTWVIFRNISLRCDGLRSCLSVLNVIILVSLNIISFTEDQPCSFSIDVAE